MRGSRKRRAIIALQHALDSPALDLAWRKENRHRGAVDTEKSDHRQPLAGLTVIRLLPPLVITYEQIDHLVEVLTEVLTSEMQNSE